MASLIRPGPALGTRAVRVELAAASAAPGPGDAALVVARPDDLSRSNDPSRADDPVADDTVLVDGTPERARLVPLGQGRYELLLGVPTEERRVRVLLHEPAGPGRQGRREREVIVDGWRLVVAVEDAGRAALRARARRGDGPGRSGGPTEIRAVIPGRIVSVAVGRGDAVVAGRQLAVVEAMKMQNELRAPCGGTIGEVAVIAGQTVEVGDLLLRIE